MTDRRELQVHQKQAEESTRASRHYIPLTDIHETENAPVLSMEMPGIDRHRVEVRLEKDALTVVGQVNFSNYEGLEPIYTEYGIGHYTRSFSLAHTIDQGAISARADNGVLFLNLTKTP